MKKYSIRISKTAIKDLETIWAYSEKKWSVKQAEKYYRELWSEIELIQTNPLIGKTADRIKIGYRVHFALSHVIFYTISSSAIKITRILHQKNDFQKWLD